MNTELYWRLLTLVTLRGLTHTNVGWYRWMTTWDDGAQWDVATCGPVPTLSEIAAVTVAQIDAVKQAAVETEAHRLADDIVARSVARVAWEELKKCQVRNGQTLLDWQQFRDAIKAAIKDRLNGGQ